MTTPADYFNKIIESIEVAGNRQDEKLGAIAEKLAMVESVQLEQKEILDEHIRRTIANENSINVLRHSLEQHQITEERVLNKLNSHAEEAKIGFNTVKTEKKRAFIWTVTSTALLLGVFSAGIQLLVRAILGN